MVWCRHSQTSDQSCWFNHFFQVFQGRKQVTSMESHQDHDKKGIYTTPKKLQLWMVGATQTASSCCAATVNAHWMWWALLWVSGIRGQSYMSRTISLQTVFKNVQIWELFFYWQQSLLSLPVLDVKRGIHFL